MPLVPTGLRTPPCRFCPEGVGALLAGDGLRSSPECQYVVWPTHRIHSFATASRQIVGKPDSYAFGRSEGRTSVRFCFCPQGVGALLAGDGLRSSPECRYAVWPTHRIHPFATASRQIVGKPDSYAFGRSKGRTPVRFASARRA